MAHLLVVEDDPLLGKNICLNLQLDGYQVTLAESLNIGRDQVKAQKYDLIIQDLNLSDGHGFEMLDFLKKNNLEVPVIILTAISDEDSVVEGLQRGAKDYMRKPFGYKELLVRIKATLKEPLFKEKQLRFGSVILMLDKQLAKIGEKNIKLHRREFEVLKILMERAETIVSRASLIEQLDKEGEIFDRTVDSHVSHLRAHLREAGVLDLKISSVYGVGYRLEKV